MDFSRQINDAIAQMGDVGEAKKRARAIEVRNEYKQVIQAVYGNSARLFLDHTNAVYIMTKNEVKTLIVYVDESIFSAELNAQRELIKLRFLAMFKEEIETFEILVSRGKYKLNHPFAQEEPFEPEDHFVASVALDENERKLVDERVGEIQNTRVAEALRKAMTTDLEWKKGISD